MLFIDSTMVDRKYVSRKTNSTLAAGEFMTPKNENMERLEMYAYDWEMNGSEGTLAVDVDVCYTANSDCYNMNTTSSPSITG